MQTEFFPLGAENIEPEIANAEFALAMGQGMKKWKELGHSFPADALLLYRMSQASITQELLTETMRLAAVVCKGGSLSQLRDVAKSALILFATAPSKCAKEIMDETGTHQRIELPTPSEVQKVVNILNKINAKYSMIVFPDKRQNPETGDGFGKVRKALSAETKAKMRSAKKGENNPMYGKRHAAESRAQMSSTHKGEHDDPMRFSKANARDNVQIFINGRRIPLKQFIQRAKE